MGVGSLLDGRSSCSLNFSSFRFLVLHIPTKADRDNRPLPRGEVRDMPDESKVHHSAIKRMHANPDYRPGNLILGGGGRGVKRAPKSAGIGEWIVVKEAGDIVGEAFVRKKMEGENGKTKEEK